jgi:hypothetical protein
MDTQLIQDPERHDARDLQDAVLSAVVEDVPQYIAVGVGLAYATGFLVVLTFLERFGIHETGGDLFKIKYIHVGILALFLPVACVVPSILTLSMAWSTKSGASQNLKVGAANFLLMANMLLCLAIFVLFAPPHFFRDREWVLPAVFGATFAGLFLIWCLKWFCWNPEHENLFFRRLSELGEAGSVERFLKLVLLQVAIALAAGTAWRGLTKDVWAIFWGEEWFPPKGAIFYVLLTCLWIYAIARTHWFASEAKTRRLKIELYSAGIIVAGGIYFLSIIAFSYRVYPYVPHERGGGDFTNSPLVTLYVSTQSGALPDRLKDNAASTKSEIKSIPVIVIDQSTTSLYVADYADEGGPFEWRKSERLPHVVELPASTVRFVDYHAARPHLLAQLTSKKNRTPLPAAFVDHIDNHSQVSKKLFVVKEVSKFLVVQPLPSATTKREGKINKISISRHDLDNIDLFHAAPTEIPTK